MNINLRPISNNDFEFIYKVTEITMRTYVELTWKKWDDEQQRTLIYDSINASADQIIQLDGQDVGCFAVERHPTHLQLTKLYLLPQFQRRGIGTFLLQQLIAEAKQRQLPLRLRVLAINPARQFYQQQGFVVREQTKERWVMEYIGENADA
jgi:GNAT superfamily N-acetyltransferase